MAARPARGPPPPRGGGPAGGAPGGGRGGGAAGTCCARASLSGPALSVAAWIRATSPVRSAARLNGRLCSTATFTASSMARITAVASRERSVGSPSSLSSPWRQRLSIVSVVWARSTTSWSSRKPAVPLMVWNTRNSEFTCSDVAPPSSTAMRIWSARDRPSALSWRKSPKSDTVSGSRSTRSGTCCLGSGPWAAAGRLTCICRFITASFTASSAFAASAGFAAARASASTQVPARSRMALSLSRRRAAWSSWHRAERRCSDSGSEASATTTAAAVSSRMAPGARPGRWGEELMACGFPA